MKKILARLLQARHPNIIGLDIGTENIKLAEVSTAGREPLLVKAAIVKIPPGSVKDNRLIDEKSVASQLRQALAMSAASALNAVIGISGPGVFLREFAFPAMTEHELKEAVFWEIKRYTSYDQGSFYYDYAVITKAPTETKTKVMVAAAPKDIIDPLMSLVKPLKIKPIAIEIEAMAIGRTLEQTDKAVIIDLGGSMSQATVYWQGHLNVSRSIPIGGQDFTKIIMSHLNLSFDEAEKVKKNSVHLLHHPDSMQESSPLHCKLEAVVNELAKQVRQTVEFFRVQNRHGTIEKVFLIGGGANLHNLSPQLSFHLGLPVALVQKPLNLKIADSFQSSFDAKLFPQLATAIGLAFRTRAVGA